MIKIKSDLAIRFTFAFLLLIFVALAIKPNLVYGSETSASKVKSVMIEILRNTAEIGLEEAGSRILGPTAWKYFKAAAKPLVDVLRKRYPTLFNNEMKQTGVAREEAAKAISDFSSEKELTDLLLKGFNNLETGQVEIMNRIDLLNTQLNQVNSSIVDMKNLNTAMLTEILNKLNKLASKDNDIETIEPSEQALEFFRSSEIAAGLKGKPEVIKAVEEIFKIMPLHDYVLNEGHIGKGYRKTIDGVEHTIHLDAGYKDFYGRECKETTRYRKSENAAPETHQIAFCKDQDGQWQAQSFKPVNPNSANVFFEDELRGNKIRDLSNSPLYTTNYSQAYGLTIKNLSDSQTVTHYLIKPELFTELEPNVRIDITIQQRDKNENSLFGLMFGTSQEQPNNTKGYSFLVNGKGQYVLSHLANNTWEYLVNGVDSILARNPILPRYISILIRDRYLEYYVSNRYLGNIELKEMPKGFIGVFLNPGTEVSVTYLRISRFVN